MPKGNRGGKISSGAGGSISQSHTGVQVVTATAGGGGGSAFEALQGFTRKSSTSDLLTAFNRYGNADQTKLNGTEKLARAVVIDELAERGAILYDRGTGEYVRNTQKKPVVNLEEGSYRIDSFTTREVRRETTQGQSELVGTERVVNGVSVYINGAWSELRPGSVRSKKVDEEYFKNHKR